MRFGANWEASPNYLYCKHSHLNWKEAKTQNSLTVRDGLRGIRPDCYSAVC